MLFSNWCDKARKAHGYGSCEYNPPHNLSIATVLITSSKKIIITAMMSHDSKKVGDQRYRS